ncbi:hypothetical protein AWR38_16765 [Idiomarina sp. WRN-38]|nr:hypothetical protein AUR68_16745 [Idiomarina sp. H105]OAE99528.1 hypothetical protein AWR38_16765 [Idiomarina sp. WRN-38]
MPIEVIFTLLVIASVLGMLALTRVAPDMILMAALAFLVVSGILTPPGVIVKFCVWPVRRQSCLTDRSRVRHP